MNKAVIEYWYSEAANAWLVANIETGTLIAQCPDVHTIGRIFEADAIRYAFETCDKHWRCC